MLPSPSLLDVLYAVRVHWTTVWPPLANCRGHFVARPTQLVVVSRTPWHGDATDIAPTLGLLDELVADVNSPTHGKVRNARSTLNFFFPLHRPPRLSLGCGSCFGDQT